MKSTNRRNFIAGLGAGSASLAGLGALSVSRPAAAADGSAARNDDAPRAPATRRHVTMPTDLENPAALPHVYRLIRFAANDSVLFWWMKGRRYGFVDGKLLPFFDMQIGSMHRCRERGDGGYDVTSATAMYFTDLADGGLVESWANPLTGKTVKFGYPAPLPSKVRYSYENVDAEAPPTPGARTERRHVVAPIELIGEEAWLREETYLSVMRDGAARVQNVHDTYTYSSPVAALRDTRRRVAPAVAHFNDYNDWSPRFEMGNQPGYGVARCSGRKAMTLDELPASFLRLARRLHGDAFRDPARTLG